MNPANNAAKTPAKSPDTIRMAKIRLALYRFFGSKAELSGYGKK